MKAAQRAAAKIAGLSRYFTSKPCPRGHVADRFVSNGTCVVCTQELKQKRCTENPELERKQARDRRLRRLDHYRARDRATRIKNIERVRKSLKRWRENNNAEYLRNKRKNDIQFRLAESLRTRLRLAIKGNHKSGSAARDLGCTIPELVSWIESQFQEGMTWENWGLWHLDHKKPLSSFDLTDREQLLRACHWSNLQPLWASDNLSKGAKYEAA